MPLRFSFRQLEYLVAVGEAGTIALAAQRVNVSSPSISSAISQLETDLGLQLFVRHHAQGLTLTPGGRRVFNEAKQILFSANGLNDLANTIVETARGPISVGALSTVAPVVSAQLRRSFEAGFPDALVTLKEGSQADLLRMLGQAEIDVAITYDIEIPKDVAFEALVSLPPYVMLAADHAKAKQASLSLADLQDEPMVLLDLPISREYFLSMFQHAGFRPNITERTADMFMARSLVANGFGFGLVNMRTRSDIAPDGERLVILPLTGAVRPVVLGLATKQSAHRSGIVQAFFTHVQDHLQTQGLPGMHVPL
ncbi:LysR family transcriptional regulator [Pseudorhodobacter sp. W20_MBD10_FR17]|uniref:LysR family transcriptional regulator n=1 Tax=Pseudorhodobacter sp. W20_MBD10_FR17 TaxID=3240266 RepID=UPI003F99377A